MTARLISMIVLTLTLTHPAIAEVIVTGWLETHQVLFRDPQPRATTPQLVFADTTPRLIVRIFMNPLRRGKGHEDVREHQRLAFGAHPWWSNITLILKNKTTGAGPTIADARFVTERVDREGERESTTTIRDDEIVYAEFDLPPLPVGDYELSTELRVPRIGTQVAHVVRSESPFAFSVRRGTEDADTRRAYLRARAALLAATPGVDRFERFRATLLDLIELEPRNPGNFEWLGDLAASLATVEEAIQYHEKALQMVQENLVAKYGPAQQWSDEIKEFWRARQKALTALRRANAVARPGMTMSVQNDGREKRILLYSPGDYTASHRIE